MAAWRADTGIRLTLLAHVPEPADEQRLREHLTAAGLDDVVTVRGTAPVLDALGPAAAGRRIGPPPRDHAYRLPTLPRSPVAAFRADCWRRQNATDFAHTDGQYRAGYAAARTWLARTLPPPPPPAESTEPAGGRPAEPTAFDLQETEAVRLFLARLTVSSPSHQHTVARVRGAQAGFLTRSLLLNVPDDLTSCAGPGLTTVPRTPRIVHTITVRLPNPLRAAAIAALLFTGTATSLLSMTQIASVDDAGTTVAIDRDSRINIGEPPGPGTCTPSRPAPAPCCTPPSNSAAAPRAPLITTACSRTASAPRHASRPPSPTQASRSPPFSTPMRGMTGTPPPAAGTCTPPRRQPPTSCRALGSHARDRPAPAARRHVRGRVRPDVPARARRECRLTDEDLTALTGIPATDFDTHLTPRTLPAAAALFPLARALNTSPESLLLQPRQATRPVPGAATHATVLHAALLEVGRIHPDDLASALEWPPHRLKRAASPLAAHLDQPSSPHRLVHTDTTIHLTCVPGLLDPKQRQNLHSTGHTAAALAPGEAAALTRLLYRTARGLTPDLPADQIPRLANRRLLAPAGKQPAPHPDVLFALGLAAHPADHPALGHRHAAAVGADSAGGSAPAPAAATPPPPGAR